MNTVKIDFPLTANAEFDPVVRDWGQTAASELAREFADCDAVALVLGGSLARGEGSLLVVDGIPKLLSDFDFSLIIGSREGVVKAHAKVARVLKSINEFLQPKGVASYVDCGFALESELKTKPISLFTFEFTATARILTHFGNEYVFPRHRIEDVDPIEGIVLLNNRIIEQLKYHVREGSEVWEPALATAYIVGRTYADLGKVILLTRGSYALSYQARKKSILHLATTGQLNTGLAERISWWTEAKLNPAIFEARLAEEITPALTVAQWQRELAADLTELWLEAFQRTFRVAAGTSRQVLAATKIATPLHNIKSWLLFWLRGDRTVIPLTCMVRNMLRFPPLWASYLAGFFEYRRLILKENFDFDVAASLFGQRGDETSDLFLVRKILWVWEFIAMGGRHQE